MGAAPKEGEPGRVEFTFPTVPQEYDFRILPDGRIDYKNSANILMAVKDTLLARIFTLKTVYRASMCRERKSSQRRKTRNAYAETACEKRKRKEFSRR